MTLLHQAAQKAVEVLKLAHHGMIPGLALDKRTAAAIAQLESALQHQEEPSTAVIPPAPPECETEDEKTAFSFGYWQGLHAARKGQEEPREPVAPRDAIAVNLVRLAGLTKDKARQCESIVRQVLAASPSTTRQQEVATWLLYEHEDGHHAVAPTAEAATFAQGDPAWHRVGPVEVSSESLPYRSAAGDTLASIAQAELRDMNRWPEILSLNTHVLDGAAGPGSKPRAGTLLTLPSPSTARQQEVGSGYPEGFDASCGLSAHAMRTANGLLCSVIGRREWDVPMLAAALESFALAAAPSTPEKAGGESEPARGNTICNPHPDAPHGFNRNASHSAGRYVCECEGWMPPMSSPIPHPLPAQANDGGEHG